MRFDLIRFPEVDGATLGALLIDDFPTYASLELPWRGNQVGVSCVPPGEYQGSKITSPKHGVCYLLSGPPIDGVRSEILFAHVGNFVDDTRGCILLGLSYGRISGRPAIRESALAIKRFRQRVAGVDQIILRIKNAD